MTSEGLRMAAASFFAEAEDDAGRDAQVVPTIVGEVRPHVVRLEKAQPQASRHLQIEAATIGHAEGRYGFGAPPLGQKVGVHGTVVPRASAPRTTPNSAWAKGVTPGSTRKVNRGPIRYENRGDRSTPTAGGAVP